MNEDRIKSRDKIRELYDKMVVLSEAEDADDAVLRSTPHGSEIVLQYDHGPVPEEGGRYGHEPTKEKIVGLHRLAARLADEEDATRTYVQSTEEGSEIVLDYHHEKPDQDE